MAEDQRSALFQSIRSRYIDAFRKRLGIDRVVECVTASEDELFDFRAKIPVYGLHRNIVGSTTYFDDLPHVTDIATLHADAFQSAPLFGDVVGYSGEVLFGKQAEKLHFSPGRSLAATARELVDRVRDVAGGGTPVAVVGSGSRIFHIERTREAYAEQGTFVKYVKIPRAPRHLLFATAVGSQFARLETHPSVGQVDFGSPVDVGQRHEIEAVASNRLSVKRHDAVWIAEIEAPGGEVSSDS